MVRLPTTDCGEFSTRNPFVDLMACCGPVLPWEIGRGTAAQLTPAEQQQLLSSLAVQRPGAAALGCAMAAVLYRFRAGAPAFRYAA